jgi:hypothetical protein
MAKIDELVKNFLAQKKIAVVGVSDKRETGCNMAYKKFKASGYQVFAVNPRISLYEGDPCYPDLQSLPEKPEAVFILANPKVTDQIVQQCVDLGVKHVPRKQYASAVRTASRSSRARARINSCSRMLVII